MKMEHWIKICDALEMPPDSGIMDIVKKANILTKAWKEKGQFNSDLLEACKDAYNLIALTRPDTCGYVLIKLSDAIAKSEGRG